MTVVTPGKCITHGLLAQSHHHAIVHWLSWLLLLCDVFLLLFYFLLGWCGCLQRLLNLRLVLDRLLSDELHSLLLANPDCLSKLLLFSLSSVLSSILSWLLGISVQSEYWRPCLPSRSLVVSLSI